MVLGECSSHLGGDEGGAKQILFKLMQEVKRFLHRSQLNSKCNKKSWTLIVKEQQKGTALDRLVAL